MAFRISRCAVVLTCAGLWLMVPRRISAQVPELGGATIRSVGPIAAVFVNEGRERSATFRKLVEELESSDWIVFVQKGSCRLAGVTGCLLHQVGRYNSLRYLRVVVSEPFGSDDETIATIGHELQHVVEVVRAPGISDAGDIRQSTGVSVLCRSDDALRVKLAKSTRLEMRSGSAQRCCESSEPTGERKGRRGDPHDDPVRGDRRPCLVRLVDHGQATGCARPALNLM